MLIFYQRVQRDSSWKKEEKNEHKYHEIWHEKRAVDWIECGYKPNFVYKVQTTHYITQTNDMFHSQSFRVRNMFSFWAAHILSSKQPEPEPERQFRLWSGVHLEMSQCVNFIPRTLKTQHAVSARAYIVAAACAVNAIFVCVRTQLTGFHINNL